MLRSILSNPSLCPYSNSLATLLVMGVVFSVLARVSRSIHSHFKHSCRQKLIVKERGCRRQIRYKSDFPKAPGCLCCCRMLSRDLNSDFTPVSSNTSRTAVSPTWKRQTNRDFVPWDAVKGLKWKSGRLKAKVCLRTAFLTLWDALCISDASETLRVSLEAMYASTHHLCKKTLANTAAVNLLLNPSGICSAELTWMSSELTLTCLWSKPTAPQGKALHQGYAPS